MRVLVWQEQHPTVHGGAESWAIDTSAALKLRGHDVAWLQTSQIAQAVHAFHPDVVVLGTIHCFVGLDNAEYLSRLEMPAVWMLHDYWPFCEMRMLMRDDNRSDQSCPAVEGLCRPQDCGAARRASPAKVALVNRFRPVAECDGAAEIMRRNGLRIWRVIETGIDTDLFVPGVKDQRRVVYTHSAGKDMWKGGHILAAALEGTDIELRYLTGLPRAEIARELGQASVYVFPSVYQETWGLALTEAMACGCACIASNVAGARAQIHHDGLGLLVPPGDSAELRRAIEHLLGDGIVRGTLGNNARAHVAQDHSIAAIGERWERLLQEAVQ